MIKELPPSQLDGMEATPCLLCGHDAAVPYLASNVQLAPGGREIFHFVRCSQCDLVYLNPRPTEAEIARFYPPEYLPHRGPEAWGRWSSLVERAQARTDRKRVGLLRKHRRIDENTRILDFGCGRPTFLRKLHRSTGAHAVGMDLGARGWASEPESWGGLHLLEGGLPDGEARLRELSGTGFEIITLWHALEHDYHPSETLRSLRRVAASGALLVVEVPDLSSLGARLHGPDWAGLHTPRHTTMYTRDTLREMLVRSGWSPTVQLRYGTLDPYILRWLSHAIGQGRILSGSLERDFPRFFMGKLAWLPFTLLQRWLPLGVQTVVATAR